MSHLLDGAGRAELRRILLDAFDRDKLDRALREASPAHDFDSLVADSAFADQVAELIDRAERAGWLGQFTRILEDELPRREDLHARLRAVLDAAAARAAELESGDETVTPDVALRGRLLTLAGSGAALGLAGGLLGVVSGLGDPQAGPWPLVLGGVCLLGAVVFAALLATTLMKDRLGDGALSFARSKLPLAALGGLAALTAVNGWLAVAGDTAGRPNFILQVVDGTAGERAPVADQPVHLAELVNPGEESDAVERRTDINGQAFFTVRLGSGFLYTGGILITEGDRLRNCSFPAFPVRQAQSIVQDVAALNCITGPAGTRTVRPPDAGLRVSASFPSVGPLPREVRDSVPVSLSARDGRAPLGAPGAPLVMDRLFYSVGYDPARRVPLWTAYSLDGAGARPAVPAAEEDFRPDPALPDAFQAPASDYEGNPFRRGRLVPASEALAMSRDAAAETFYYTASVPQAGVAGQTGWSRLADFVRGLARRGGRIHVMSGPVYDQRLVMGPGETLVPVEYFKVLLRRGPDGRWHALGLIVANDGDVIDAFDPRAAVVPVTDVEARTGLKFFPDLPPDEATRVKANADIDAFLPAIGRAAAWPESTAPDVSGTT